MGTVKDDKGILKYAYTRDDKGCLSTAKDEQGCSSMADDDRR